MLRARLIKANLDQVVVLAEVAEHTIRRALLAARGIRPLYPQAKATMAVRDGQIMLPLESAAAAVAQVLRGQMLLLRERAAAAVTALLRQFPVRLLHTLAAVAAVAKRESLRAAQAVVVLGDIASHLT